MSQENIQQKVHELHIALITKKKSSHAYQT